MVSRFQTADALATESCWETTIAAKPWNPAGRRRSGGSPGRLEQRRKPRIDRDQLAQRGVEIGFGMDEGRHFAATISEANPA